MGGSQIGDDDVNGVSVGEAADARRLAGSSFIVDPNMLSRPLSIVLLSGAVLAGCAADKNSPEQREESGRSTSQSTFALERGDTTTISGTLIDTHCYADDPDNVGRHHDRQRGHVRDCAALCARQGLPAGVLADDGTVWVLVTAPAVLADYMAGTVRIRGEVRSDGVLIPHRVEVRRGNEWTFVL